MNNIQSVVPFGEVVNYLVCASFSYLFFDDYVFSEKFGSWYPPAPFFSAYVFINDVFLLSLSGESIGDSLWVCCYWYIIMIEV